MTYKSDGYIVTCTLDPKPLPSLHLNSRFTRIDYTAKCTMNDVLEGMAGLLKISSADLTLEAEALTSGLDLPTTPPLPEKDGKRVILDQYLVDFSEQNSELRSPRIEGKWRRRHRPVKTQPKEINLKVRHIASPNQLVNCIISGGEGRHALRRTVVRLSNMATVGELIIRGRSQRYGAIQREGPVYGNPGELETTLRDSWVRNGCEVDGSFHIGLAVVVLIPGQFERTLSFVMGPRDVVGDVKRRITSNMGTPMSRQILCLQGGTQRRLADGISLKECCNAGGEVEHHTGWSELHLELMIKNFFFSDDILFSATVVNDIDANEHNTVSHRHYSKNERAWISSASPPQHWWGRGSYSPPLNNVLPPPSPGAFSTEALVQVGSTFAKNKGKRRQKTCHGNGRWPVEFFALSPSGQALTLTVPEGGSVLDAKGQVEVHEGVPPCHQRLLWRGILLEPDHASLHMLGVRGGDTLIVGYRTPRALSETFTPVIELRGIPGYSSRGTVETGHNVRYRDEAFSPRYTGNISPNDEGKLAGSQHGDFPAGTRMRNSRVNSEYSGMLRGNGRGPTNASSRSNKQIEARGTGRNGSSPGERGYMNRGTRNTSTPTTRGQNVSGWVRWKHGRHSPASSGGGRS